jgi:hypothetical protein
MAVGGTEVEVLRNGVLASSPSRGSFALNMLKRQGAWEVRNGFGEVMQADTTMSNNITATQEGARVGVMWGHMMPLGSHYMVTDFGHEQIVSVCTAIVNTSNDTKGATQSSGIIGNQFGSNNLVATVYSVTIYDITSKEVWEEVLYTHTAENYTEQNADPSLSSDEYKFTRIDKWHGNYETSADNDYQEWVHGTEEAFYFKEFQDILYFGNSVTGVLAYIPCVFRGNRRKFVSGVLDHQNSLPYSESSLLVKAFPSKGLFSEAFTYLLPAELPNPTHITVSNQRMVYVSGNLVYISDRRRPTNIIADNFFIVDTESEIVAVGTTGSGIVLLTENEVWLYRMPDNSDIVSGGLLRRLSDNIGCASASAIANVGESLLWVDRNGVYTLGPTFQLNKISEPIDPFFTDYISNPVTSYYTQAGFTDLASEQPRSRYSFEGATLASMPSPLIGVCYADHLGAVFITVPAQGISLCYAENEWSVWSYESNVYTSGGNSFPGITQDSDNPMGFIVMPWLVASKTDLFLIGGMDRQTLTDQIKVGGGVPTLDDNTSSRSFYLLRYGRGGAIDRSLGSPDYREDRRVLTGKYKRWVSTANDGIIYVDEWQKMPIGYALGGGQTPSTQSQPIYLLPISLFVPDDAASFANGIDVLTCYIAFDNNKWEPVFRAAAGATIDFLLPPERAPSIGGYTAGAGKVECWDATPAANRAGNILVIEWDTAAAAGYKHAGFMNVTMGKKNPMIYIPMRQKGSHISDNQTSGMGLTPYSVSAIHDSTRAPPAQPVNFYIWEQWTNPNPRDYHDVAQPVDWAYRTANVGDGKEGIKARGLWARMLSHGAATTSEYLNTNWMYGLFNIAVGSEWKDWIAQIVDYTGDTPALKERISKGTIRTRFKSSAGALSDVTFDNSELKWGNIGNSAIGNCLIGDEEVNTMATSLSVKGRQFAYLLFGHIQNRAQKIRLESVSALIRIIGGRRRRGR